MFAAPVYLNSNLAINFERQMDIRRKSNDFEDILKGKGYLQPQLISVPDDFDPAAPRLLFGTENGLSHVIISQIGINLIENYSAECEKSKIKAKEYLVNKSPILLELFRTLGDIKPYFIGLISIVRLSSQAESSKIVPQLSHKLLLEPEKKDEMNEIIVKLTSIIEKRFFSNVIWQNYKIWGDKSSGLQRLADSSAIERGLEIRVDFNDRYAFNEKPEYYSDTSLIKDIIEGSFVEIDKAIKKVEE